LSRLGVKLGLINFVPGWIPSRNEKSFCCGYFFLPATCLAAMACAFLSLALFALACFCEDIF